ncbi:unnamed protein product, partial [Meganyctiphanes norvegica]
MTDVLSVLFSLLLTTVESNVIKNGGKNRHIIENGGKNNYNNIRNENKYNINNIENSKEITLDGTTNMKNYPRHMIYLDSNNNHHVDAQQNHQGQQELNRIFVMDQYIQDDICIDLRPQCPDWAMYGWCKYSHVYDRCKVSCDICDPNCFDIGMHCDIIKAYGYCAPRMDSVCRRTCETCGVKISTEVSFKLTNKVYNDKLADPKSTAFAILKTEVEFMLTEALKKKLGRQFSNVLVKSFIKGSVIVNSEITTTAENQHSADELVSTALKESEIPGLNVSSVTVVGNEDDNHHDDDDHDDDEDDNHDHDDDKDDDHDQDDDDDVHNHNDNEDDDHGHDDDEDDDHEHDDESSRKTTISSDTGSTLSYNTTKGSNNNSSISKGDNVTSLLSNKTTAPFGNISSSGSEGNSLNTTEVNVEKNNSSSIKGHLMTTPSSNLAIESIEENCTSSLSTEYPVATRSSKSPVSSKAPVSSKTTHGSINSSRPETSPVNTISPNINMGYSNSNHSSYTTGEVTGYKNDSTSKINQTIIYSIEEIAGYKNYSSSKTNHSISYNIGEITDFNNHSTSKSNHSSFYNIVEITGYKNYSISKTNDSIIFTTEGYKNYSTSKSNHSIIYNTVEITYKNYSISKTNHSIIFTMDEIPGSKNYTITKTNHSVIINVGKIPGYKNNSTYKPNNSSYTMEENTGNNNSFTPGNYSENSNKTLLNTKEPNEATKETTNSSHYLKTTLSPKEETIIIPNTVSKDYTNQ